MPVGVRIGSPDVAESAAVSQAETINLQRIPLTIDPFGEAGSKIASDLTPFRTAAVTKIYLGLQHVKANLGLVTAVLAVPPLPSVIVGSLAQPGGSPAANLQVQFDPASVGATGPATSVVTSDAGVFTLAMPRGAALSPNGLAFVVHGADGNTSFTLEPAQVAANGLVGTVTLPRELAPLPVSILAALAALIPASVPVLAPPAPSPSSLPQVTLGEEDGACGQSFAADATLDTFPFGVFFRLVEPQMSIVFQLTGIPQHDDRFIGLPDYATGYSTDPHPRYADRVPIEQPLSVDGFLDQIAGITTTGTFTADETVPMAATLGLGYILRMSQRWQFKGLGLGDLVYSLPLAPGEQTQVAVFERTDTSEVFESDSFSEQEAEAQQSLADTSTLATFNSAFDEASAGGSQSRSGSASASTGVLGLIFGGAGASGSTSSGSEWMTGQRDSTQLAAEQTHASSESAASARRSANRTGMRLASTTESESVTTKTITNHNHTRALTLQYWQVLRMYDVSTAIDGLTLTCLVPMQIVRFMPPGQPQTITAPAQVGARSQVLQRYANIIKHLDVLAASVPRKFRYGLTLLEQFASDPSAQVDSEGGVAEDVIRFTLRGSFVTCEDVSVVAVTRRGTRVGPAVLSSAVSGQPPELPPNTFVSQDDLLAWLLNQRQTTNVALEGSLALPPTMNRSDIVGFEITRGWRTVRYTLLAPTVAGLASIAKFFVIGPAPQNATADSASLVGATITLTGAQLEPAVGGPNVTFFRAGIEEMSALGTAGLPSPAETYASDQLSSTVLPLQPFPVPAAQLAPVLRYNELLEIEKTAQHVVRNTTRYSKAVWSSLSNDERAILLDGYTIGVPADGVSDSSQLVPLLNCVQNRVLGFFGNSMILPFIIPQSVADSLDIDPARLQQSLLAYQQATFAPPHSTIGLPTQGVLGEGVLGHCPSAEKIDLTRFWNWQDSPSDAAPTISPVTLSE